MRIIDILQQMLPGRTDAFASLEEGDDQSSLEDCPTWPPDLFAVTGRIIETSGCYTVASPDHGSIAAHRANLASISAIVTAWDEDLMVPPQQVKDLWHELLRIHGDTTIDSIERTPAAAKCLLKLFAIADEACKGMGWGTKGNATATSFAELAFVCMTMTGRHESNLQLQPQSLCSMVSRDQAVVLPKSITASVGCTIRSLSHYLALLPPSSVVDTSWTLPPAGRAPDVDLTNQADPYDIRLLLIPFPFRIPAKSFVLTEARQGLGGKHYWPAYFGLEPLWLKNGENQLTGEEIANKFIRPLIEQATEEAGEPPHGIVLPECALTQEVADDLVDTLANSGIEFVITGVLHVEDGKTYNRACTFVLDPNTKEKFPIIQKKHHRWRLDRTQTDRYALDFDPDHKNDKWWEDIDVSCRALPFFGLRSEMSFVTLICEDLARSDPAMSVIRAVGPNLVVALLMDGPQLSVRWPGKYATVLAEDPGSAVLTLTCAAMVDRANWPESRPARSIALWRDAGGKVQEIALPERACSVLLTLQSKQKHQSTLDLRSDSELSRQLILRTIVPIFLVERPGWV